MELVDFYKKYIPALEIALSNDDLNTGYNVYDPSFYLDLSFEEQMEFDLFVDKLSGKNVFLDMVSYYFDAKSHNFPNIQGVDLNEYKRDIIERMNDLKLLYGIGNV